LQRSSWEKDHVGKQNGVIRCALRMNIRILALQGRCDPGHKRRHNEVFPEQFDVCEFFCIILRFNMFDLQQCFASVSGLPSISFLYFSLHLIINPMADEIMNEFLKQPKKPK
jgi:hypothetical protein